MCHITRYDAHKILVHPIAAILHAHFNDTKIQFELRWRSNSFKDYLRNVLRTSGCKRYALTNFDPDKVEF